MLFLRFQNPGRLIQLPRQQLRHTLFRKPDRFLPGKPLDSHCHRAQRTVEEKSQQQAQNRDKKQVADQPRPYGIGDLVQKRQGFADIVFPDGIPGVGSDQKTVIGDPGRHGIIVQVPFTESGDLGNCIGMAQILRKLPLPYDVPGVVQKHGPGIVSFQIVISLF